MSLRPEPISTDLYDRIYSSSSTAESLEILSRRGMVPLFVGNKPIWDAGAEVQKVNTFRAEEGLEPCQPKNVMFMYCTAKEDDRMAALTEEWIWTANRDVNVHYGFADASNFKGVKGYEAYAAREATATAVLASAVTGDQKKGGPPGYHASNLLIGTPEQVFEKLKAAQEACSFSEVTIVPQFGTMPYEDAMESTRLFAAEVLPAVHEMPAPLHPAALPEGVSA